VSAAEPTVAVVVVTWNSAAPLPGLVDTLDAGLTGLRYRLIVVDNDSADDTVALTRRLAPTATIVETGRNAGYAAGINAGLAVAGEYDAVLVLNPDIRLFAGCVRTLYQELGNGVGIAVPMIRHSDGALAHSLRREPSIPRALGEAVLGQRAGRIAYLGETILAEPAYRTPGSPDWATGAIMLISRGCADACGPWDESFFLYSEETEFALRARDRGYRTRYVPAAGATHLGGQSRVSPSLWSILTVNRVRLYRMRHTRAATGVYWTAVFLRETSRAMLGQRRSRRAVAALLGRS
jgi:N-acetylglucosaminyl-diphospho-decaprenol L-rhamnosyltransferase